MDSDVVAAEDARIWAWGCIEHCSGSCSNCICVYLALLLRNELHVVPEYSDSSYTRDNLRTHTHTVVSRRWMAAGKAEPSWKVALGALMGLGWAVFLYIWFSSYAAGYTPFENVVIFFVLAAVMGVFQSVVYAPWRAEIQEQGMGWRVAVSAVMGVGWLVFVIIWFFFLSAGFTAYQNIAIVLISILILGAVMGVTWAPWAIKHAHRTSK